jgi:hypothetical protein
VNIVKNNRRMVFAGHLTNRVLLLLLAKLSFELTNLTTDAYVLL